ncbi:MAG: sugar nucleotide-binding protein [Butyrivibrio sp.]|nr:sugar nucleotide-binding protein [Butyrivibrio sp.]
MTALVGYTGFVGSNIYAKGSAKAQHSAEAQGSAEAHGDAAKNGIEPITAAYNSKNIEEAFGTKPDLLIYAGLRAEKYLANNAPEKDMELILQAEDNIRKIGPRKLVLISTIDVFKNPTNVDETSPVDIENLHAYGYNRYKLEQWVRENYPDALIIRLPGLFGQNIKKNFIYDYINVIPFMLKAEKFAELSEKDPELKNYYDLQDNGFYKVNIAGNGSNGRNHDDNKAGDAVDTRELLKSKFRALGFSALNFTDSRSVYQFYNLARLWDDIQTALEHKLTLWHPATEPVSAAEVYKYLTGKEFVNELGGTPAYYDYRTIHGALFGGSDKYICDKAAVLRDIKEAVSELSNVK